MGLQEREPSLERPYRRGIVYDKWPLRLDIAIEYQDWILSAVCIFILLLWTLPCVCGRMQNRVAKGFMSWVYSRLHVFYWSLVYITLIVIFFTITILPDWCLEDFLSTVETVTFWVLDRLVKIITSVTILFGLYMVYKFRERVLVAAGLNHITFFRFGSMDPIKAWRSKMRPVEIFVWKVDGLRSSKYVAVKANDVFVECHLGQNEPMRTRVHHNAGSGCIIKESFQLNIDEAEPSQVLTLLLKDQTMLATAELGRLALSTAEICGIEDATGKRRINFDYCEEHFVPLGLNPHGQVWIAVAPVDDQDEAPLCTDC